MYWYLNKETNAAEIFGSIQALSECTGMGIDNLYRIFSRLKKLEFENDKHRIVKCSVKRSKSDSFLQ